MRRPALGVFILSISIAFAPESAHPQFTRTVVVDRGAQDPAVSPDGSQIAVGVFGSIWLVPIDGGTARQVTFGRGWNTHPAWSRDGRFLAYAHQRPGREYAPSYEGARTELVVHNLTTGGTRTLHSTDHGIAQIAYHPTEPQLVFIEARGQFQAYLWSIRVDGDSAKQLSDGDSRAIWSFGLSPDGERAAVEHVHRGATDLFVVKLDTLDVERLTETGSEQFSVNWTADGTALVYIDRDNGIERVTVHSLADGAIRQGFTSPYDGKQLAVHPDGTTAVMVTGRRLYRVDLESGGASPIPFEATFELPAKKSAGLVIGNARLFDATDGPVRVAAHVAVRDERVARVWTGEIAAGDTAAVDFVDAAGRFLMPGLMDSHFHYWPSFVHYATAALAKGITAGRDPGAEIAATLNLRDAIRLGIIDGPDMYTLGPLIDGPVGYHPMVDVLLDRPDAGPTLVRSLHELGVDGIKVYHSLAPDVLRAVVSEARRLGLPVSGDVGCTTRWETAIDAGVTSLNHVFGYRYSHLPAELQPCRDGEPWEIMRGREAVVRYVPVDPDRPEIRALFAEMVAKDAFFDPTIKVFDMTDSARARLGLDRVRDSEGTFRAYQKLVRLAHDAGVPLLAGTDGINFFDELELYEEAGIPNDVILRMASVNGARWLGKDAEFGTIEVGKRAHMLLVEGDPLTDMKDLRNTILVVKDGRVVFDGR